MLGLGGIASAKLWRERMVRRHAAAVTAAFLSLSIAISLFHLTGPASAAITNTATANGTPAGGTLVAPSANASVDVEDAAPAVTLSKTGTLNDGGDGVANAGDTISYAFTVTNTGNVTLTNITVTDPLATVSGGPIASLAPGASDSTTITAVYTITQADLDSNGGGDGDIDNTAQVTATPPTGANISNSGSEATPIAQVPSLQIVKTANTAGPVGVNDVITYTYTITNAGNVTINGVTVNDSHNGYGTPPAPGNEAILTDQAPLGDSTDAAANSSWDALAPGDTITFTSTYTVIQTDVDLLQ